MALRALTVVLTARCDLRCRYCYLGPGRSGRLAWPDLRAALDLVLGAGHPSVRLSFTGGEPLLEFPLLTRAVRHVERTRRPDERVQYSVLTNGMRLGPRQAAFFEAHRFQVNLSFDGVPAAQAQRGRATFPALDRLLDRLRRAHWTLFDRGLRVAITVTPSTIRYLGDSVDFLVARGVRTIAISPAMRQRASGRAVLEALDRQVERVFESALRCYDATGHVPVALFRRSSSDPPAGDGGAGWVCRAPTGEGIALDVDGVAYGCLLATASYQNRPVPSWRPALAALRIGRPGDPRFAQTLAAMSESARASGVFQHAGRRRSAYRRCADCEFLGRCRVCPFSTASGAGPASVDRVNDFVCAFNQAVLKYADRFPRQPDDHDLLTGRAPVPRLVRELLERGDGA